MQKRSLYQGLCISIWIISFPIMAQDAPWTHYGVRPLAMGNAFVAIANDHNALFYNPAGLARIKQWDLELINLRAQFSKRTLQAISDSNKIAQPKSDSFNATLELIEEEAGKTQHLSTVSTPFLLLPNFGLALGLTLHGSMTFHRYPSIHIRVGPEAIFPIAFAVNFLENRLSVGFGVKIRAKGGIDSELDMDSINGLTNQEEFENKIKGGLGVGGDFGILFTPIKTMAPTLGLSITDVGGTPYKKHDVGGKALKIPDLQLPSVNLGFSMRPWEKNSMYLLTAIDMHSVNQPFSFSKKINFGLELGIGSYFKIQSGLHQGYLTGGFELDVGLLAIRLAAYGVEMGPVAGIQQDRRYAFQLKLLI